jgi:hypothetical protein
MPLASINILATLGPQAGGPFFFSLEKSTAEIRESLTTYLEREQEGRLPNDKKNAKQAGKMAKQVF